MRNPIRLPLIIAAIAVIAAVAALAWPRGGGAPASAGGTTVTVAVGDIWFCDASHSSPADPCETTINVGDTVAWDFSEALATHSSTECGGGTCPPMNGGVPLWDSGEIAGGTAEPFEYTFGVAGTYNYYCTVHPFQQGRVIVLEPTTETPAATATLPLTVVPTPTRTPTPAGLVGDANKDGEVDSIDAALVLQFGAGLTSTINPNADVNDSGEVDSIDAALILQFVAGLIDEF
jgi:plastocyanin